ncbi:MAG: glycosyltransferase family 2 protein [Candidatus Hydrogenedentota bacterium]|nr:MAG: glycosyltransferase family 2 protein [Candidatus Hydrogenedentota bacterium]
MSPSNCLIIIPAYNEQDSVAEVIAKARAHAPDSDFVVVDDGSSDDTAAVVSRCGVPVLRLPCNLGYARAVQTGIKYALKKGYDTVVLLDGDGQHNPEDVVSLRSALEQEKADVVIGSRFVGNRKLTGPLGRRLGMWLFAWVTFLATGTRIYDTTSGFKAVSRRAYEKLSSEQFVDFHAEALVCLSLAGMKIAERPVAMAERRSGRSMYNWLSHFKYPLKTMLLIIISVFRANFGGGNRQ